MDRTPRRVGGWAGSVDRVGGWVGERGYNPNAYLLPERQALVLPAGLLREGGALGPVEQVVGDDAMGEVYIGPGQARVIQDSADYEPGQEDGRVVPDPDGGVVQPVDIVVEDLDRQDSLECGGRLWTPW